MSRSRSRLRGDVRRAIAAYEAAQHGHVPSDAARLSDELGGRDAIIEIAAYDVALDTGRAKPKPCCAKCGAKADAEAMNMDVVLVPRAGDDRQGVNAS